MPDFPTRMGQKKQESSVPWPKINSKNKVSSGGSRPSNKGGGGGGCSHPDPEIRGAGLPFGPQFGPFRDPPLVRINIF